MGRFRALSVLSLLLIPEPYVDNRVMNVRLSVFGCFSRRHSCDECEDDLVTSGGNGRR